MVTILRFGVLTQFHGIPSSLPRKDGKQMDPGYDPRETVGRVTFSSYGDQTSRVDKKLTFILFDNNKNSSIVPISSQLN